MKDEEIVLEDKNEYEIIQEDMMISSAKRK